MTLHLPLQLEARRLKERPAFGLLSGAAAEALARGELAPVRRLLRAGTATRQEALFAARIHGISGLLAALEEAEACGEGALFAADRARTGERGARLAADRARLGKRAEGEGLPFVPLKGTYLASERYRDASLRPAADIDLLAPEGSFEAWCRLLTSEGYVLTTRGRKDWLFARPGWRTPDGFAEDPDNPRPVELHHSLEVRLLGRWVDITEAYVAALRPARLADGIPALVPDDAHLALHLLVHAGPALVGRGLRLIQLLDFMHLTPEPDATTALLHATLGEEVAWGLVALAARALPAAPLVALLALLPEPPPARRRRWMGRPGLLTGREERRVLALAELPLCASPKAALSRLFDALPEGSFLHRAYGSGAERRGPLTLLRYYRDRFRG